MTIRQLYYTSCQQGRDGSQGFQVNAASAGLAERHEDLGLRLSAYRPSPSAPALPTPEQIERFPVAVGYRSFGDVAVLFHSRYLGTDFTGRQGNYFAHILVLDAPDRDLNGMLPVEAWGSTLWSWQPTQNTQLPVVNAIPAGPFASAERIRSHLLQGRLPEFGVLLSAVQQGLSGRAGRIVVVAPGAEDVARALAAVTRSLPTTLATAVSFTTFTSSPTDTDVLVAGTTPDVEVGNSPYGDQIVITLAADCSADQAISRYARVLGECWTRDIDAVEEVTTLAARVSPALQAAELDQFADLVELVVPAFSGTSQAPLRALEFALHRLPSVLTPVLWQRLDNQHQHGVLGDNFDDVERWSAVFTAANQAGSPPGRELESAYVRAALSRIAEGTLESSGVWLPTRAGGRRDEMVLEWALSAMKSSPQLTTVAGVLSTLTRFGVRPSNTELRSQVVEITLDELLNPRHPDGPARLKRLPEADQLLQMACAQLESRLVRDELFDLAVEESLSPAAAELLESVAQPSSRCALAASLARARASGIDRVPVLLRAVQSYPNPAAVERFALLLWPDLPTADEGVELCRRIDAAVLGATRLPQWLLERLIEDAERAKLTAADAELADLLLADELMTQPLGSAVDTVRCIQWGARFNSHPQPSKKAEQEAVLAVQSTVRAAVPVAEWTLEHVVTWMLSLKDPAYHAPILLRIVKESGSQSFLTAYRNRLTHVLASAKPATIANILPAVAFLADKNHTSRELLDIACRNALARRRKRDLDAIGRSFDSKKGVLTRLLPTTGSQPPKNWGTWWKEWREHNLPQSTLARIFWWRKSGGDG